MLAATFALTVAYVTPFCPHATALRSRVTMNEVPSRWRAVSRDGAKAPSFGKPPNVAQAAEEIKRTMIPSRWRAVARGGEDASKPSKTKVSIKPDVMMPASNEIKSWFDAGFRLTWVQHLEIPEQVEVGTWSVANAKKQEEQAAMRKAIVGFAGEAVAVTAMAGLATAAMGAEAVGGLLEKENKKKKEQLEREAAEAKEAARVAALEERMAAARRAEEAEQARIADAIYEKAKATVDKVDQECWAPRRLAEAERELKLELSALRTWPVEANLAGLKAKIAPLIATPGVSPDLVSRIERAMQQAERAKVEARAKAISDGVIRFATGAAAIGSTLVPEDKLEWLKSGQQRLPEVEEEEEEAPPSLTKWDRIRTSTLNFIAAMPPMA